MPRIFSWKIILFFLFLLVLDVSFTPALKINGIRPIFSYLFICYSAFEWGRLKTLYISVLTGISHDFLGIGFLGLETCILIVSALILDFVVHKTEREFPGIYFLLTFLFVLLVMVLKVLSAVFLGVSNGMVVGHLSQAFFTALYTSVFLPIFYHIADVWFREKNDSKQFELFK